VHALGSVSAKTLLNVFVCWYKPVNSATLQRKQRFMFTEFQTSVTFANCKFAADHHYVRVKLLLTKSAGGLQRGLSVGGKGSARYAVVIALVRTPVL
jgi:hypothetical protein